MNRRQNRELAQQRSDDSIWLKPLEDTSPENLTAWYRSYYHGNMGGPKEVCMLVLTIAALKGYKIEGRGYELRFVR